MSDNQIAQLQRELKLTQDLVTAQAQTIATKDELLASTDEIIALLQKKLTQQENAPSSAPSHKRARTSSWGSDAGYSPSVSAFRMSGLSAD